MSSYAIVQIAGKQFKVQQGMRLYTPRLAEAEGAQVSLDGVLLLEEAGKVQVGLPTLQGVSIAAKVLAHGKDKKVVVFKKKRRKGYKVTRGHRQPYTTLEIGQINKSQ